MHLAQPDTKTFALLKELVELLNSKARPPYLSWSVRKKISHLILVNIGECML